MSIPLALQSCSKAPLDKELGLYLIKVSPPGITESTYADADDTNAKTLLVLAVNSLSIISLVFGFYFLKQCFCGIFMINIIEWQLAPKSKIRIFSENLFYLAVFKWTHKLIDKLVNNSEIKLICWCKLLLSTNVRSVCSFSRWQSQCLK